MVRYSHLGRLASLGGLVAAAVIALSAMPAAATTVCPAGIKPPSPYCTNVFPTATTASPATNVTATSATLSGVAGPGVAGGDITQYFFQYGTTRAYGAVTPTGTVGACPSGITPPSPYCNIPASQFVSAPIANLTPCTTYHFQIVATNPDGRTNGADQVFRTAFVNPIENVKSPSKVKARHTFKVKFTLQYNTTDLTIAITRANGRRPVATYRYGPLAAGTYSETITAPRRRGNYRLQVIARSRCGRQTLTTRLKVR